MSETTRVATFEDWPKRKIGDLPSGAVYTQDGHNLMYKLNSEFHVPAKIGHNDAVIGDGTATRILDAGQVVGVVMYPRPLRERCGKK